MIEAIAGTIREHVQDYDLFVTVQQRLEFAITQNGKRGHSLSTDGAERLKASHVFLPPKKSSPEHAPIRSSGTLVWIGSEYYRLNSHREQMRVED
jgi:hypothetical protein